MPHSFTVQETSIDEEFELARFTRVAIDNDLSVGATLRAAREEKGQRLNYYSRKLNMPERYLRALEDEEFPLLPGLVYERHFVARYAKALSLDPEPLVDHWSAMREGEARPSTRFVPRVNKWDLWVSPLLIRRAAVALIFVIGLGYVGNRLYAMVAPPTLTVNAPAESQIFSSPSLSVSGEVPSNTQVLVNGQNVATTPDGKFAVPVTLRDGPNTIRIEADRPYSRPASIERHVFLATLPAPTTDNVSQRHSLTPIN